MHFKMQETTEICIKYGKINSVVNKNVLAKKINPENY